jgi:hypothetical protein
VATRLLQEATMRTHDVDHLVRDQLRLFGALGDDLAIPPDDRRRLLLLSQAEWTAWANVSGPGCLPPTPMLSLMLRRLGAANHRLVAITERRAAWRADASATWSRDFAGSVFMPPAANVQEAAPCP